MSARTLVLGIPKRKVLSTKNRRFLSTMRSGEIAANAIIDKEYKWKKAVKDVYRYHQVVNPGLFAMNLFEFKNMNAKRIQKIFEYLPRGIRLKITWEF